MTKVERPEINLDNIEAMYRYYDNAKPNERAQRLLISASSAMYKPEISYDDDAARAIQVAAE